MQAIITKYLPATNFKGSRIRAKCARGSILISYPHELSGEAVHLYAARELVKRFATEDFNQYKTPPDKNPWLKPRVCGGLPDGTFAHVYAGQFAEACAWMLKAESMQKGARDGCTMGEISLAIDAAREAFANAEGIK